MSKRITLFIIPYFMFLGLPLAIEPKVKKFRSHPTAVLKKPVQKKKRRKSTFDRVTIESLKMPLELDILGYPTNQTIEKIIETYWPQLGPAFTQQEQGGSSTGKIYSASHLVSPYSNQIRTTFFIKVCNKKAKDSWKRLKKIQESKVGTFCGVKNNLTPIITSVEKFFTYSDGDGIEYTIEVIHAAKGASVYEIIIENKPLHEKINCAFAIGAALSLFHQEFITYHSDIDPEQWLTVTHGDFHPSNVFFHKTSSYSRTYFIDNESMAHSLDAPSPITNDVVYFYQTSYRQLIQSKIPPKAWEEIVQFFHWFIKGYVKTYPRNKREALICHLETQINTSINNLISLSQPSAGNETHEEELFNLREKLKKLLISEQELPWYII